MKEAKTKMREKSSKFKALLQVTLVVVMALSVLLFVGCGSRTETYKFESLENNGARQSDVDTLKFLFSGAVFNIKSDNTCYYHLSNSAWVEDLTWTEVDGEITIRDGESDIFTFIRDGDRIILKTDNADIIFAKS